jgi:hypothetical protein
VTAPLTPADCDLRDFPRMMIDIPRLFSSEFDATANDAEWRFGVTLWLKSFHQVPAASLPDDDGALARLAGLGRDVKTWRKARANALRGWVKCDDGLLYHPVVAEIALEAWLEKMTQRLSSGAGNSARWGVEFDRAPIEADIGTAARLLAALNPKSKTLSKQQPALALRKSQRQSPLEVPVGHDGDPTGSAHTPPKTSLEKGREGKKEAVSDETDADASPDVLDGLAELRAMPMATGSWRLGLAVLMDQGGLTETKARNFLGKLKAAGLQPAEMWQIAESALENGTPDPIPYLSKAAEQAMQRRAAATMPWQTGEMSPSPEKQRFWMQEWVAKADWRRGDRGPTPGEAGCRVSPAIQREFGVEPAAEERAA